MAGGFGSTEQKIIEFVLKHKDMATKQMEQSYNRISNAEKKIQPAMEKRANLQQKVESIQNRMYNRQQELSGALDTTTRKQLRSQQQYDAFVLRRTREKLSLMNTEIQASKNTASTQSQSFMQQKKANLGVAEAASMSREQFALMYNTQGRVNSAAARGVMMFRDWTHGVHGFRMELLSTMFFMMGVSAAAWGLLGPAMQMTGVFDILNTTLGIFFLPIALWLTDVMLNLMEVFLSWDEGKRAIVGGVVLAIAIFATFSMVIAQVRLGFGGMLSEGSRSMRLLNKVIGRQSKKMKGQFGYMGNTARQGGAAIGRGTLLALGAFAILIAALIFLQHAWSKNWFGIRQHTGAALKGIADMIEFFKPVLMSLGAHFIVMKNTLVFHLSNLKNYWDIIWNGMYIAAATIWNSIVSGISLVANGVITFINTIIGAYDWLANALGFGTIGQIQAVDLSSQLIDTTDAYNNLGTAMQNVDKIGKNTTRQTVEDLQWWNQTLDDLTAGTRDFGDELIRQGNAIDAGEMDQDTSFIESLMGIGTAGGETPLTGSANRSTTIQNINYNPVNNNEITASNADEAAEMWEIKQEELIDKFWMEIRR